MTVTWHDEHPLDRIATAAVRAAVALHPPAVFGPAIRPDFDALIARTPMAGGVTCEPGTVAGVPGWWCHPADPIRDGVVLYLHGGGYVAGSAAAYRGLASQVAARVGATMFVPDYALAPERPFPAAFYDVSGVYKELAARGPVALAGDSAGGGLALALLAQPPARAAKPVCAAVMSPWTDLALAGESLAARAPHDPLLTREALAEGARLYLAGHDPRDPRASPLHADPTGLAPVLLHVGEDEVLLDDTLRCAARIEAAGGRAEAHVWRGMLHVFPSNPSALHAAREALDGVATFLAGHIGRR